MMAIDDKAKNAITQEPGQIWFDKERIKMIVIASVSIDQAKVPRTWTKSEWKSFHRWFRMQGGKVICNLKIPSAVSVRRIRNIKVP